jgi:hypothetical protein
MSKGVEFFGDEILDHDIIPLIAKCGRALFYVSVSTETSIATEKYISSDKFF